MARRTIAEHQRLAGLCEEAARFVGDTARRHAELGRMFLDPDKDFTAGSRIAGAEHAAIGRQGLALAVRLQKRARRHVLRARAMMEDE